MQKYIVKEWTEVRRLRSTSESEPMIYKEFSREDDAIAFAESVDIATDFATEYNCRPAGVKNTDETFCVQVEAWDEEEMVSIPYHKEYDYYDYRNEFVYSDRGYILRYEDAVHLMDDELRERLHAELAPCSNQDFFSEYEEAHKQKFGEDFEV